MSKKQLFFLVLALLVGSFLGFLAGNLVATAHTSTLRAVSKTITITQFTCSSSSNNYDTDIGQFCPLDKVPLANQPTSMNCISVTTFSSPSFTLSEKCDPNGSLVGNPFYVAWKSGYLELLVEDGTYNFNPPRVVTYSAVQ